MKSQYIILPCIGKLHYRIAQHQMRKLFSILVIQLYAQHFLHLRANKSKDFSSQNFIVIGLSACTVISRVNFQGCKSLRISRVLNFAIAPLKTKI